MGRLSGMVEGLAEDDGTSLWPGGQLDVTTITTRTAAEDWIVRLSMTGAIREDAIAQLHALMMRAARHQVTRMPEAVDLGASRREEIINAAADEATMSVLTRLDTFEGRSKFTTWAFKFGILHAGVEVRRAHWNGREINLEDLGDRFEHADPSPPSQVEASAMAAALKLAMYSVLTSHQRRVAVALLIDGVPIDVLAERLGTRRGALYKTLHDARRRLRAELARQGYLPPMPPKLPPMPPEEVKK